MLRVDLDISPGADDPSVLAGVVRVEGDVVVNGTTLTDLDFMACLREVTGAVQIFGNAQLTDVDGLWSLRAAGDLVFAQNTALTDFDGAPNLERIDNLVMNANTALTQVSGFHSLLQIESNATIRDNDVLTNIDGLGGLTYLGGVFAVTANPLLCASSFECVGNHIVEPKMQMPPPFPPELAEC